MASILSTLSKNIAPAGHPHSAVRHRLLSAWARTLCRKWDKGQEMDLAANPNYNLTDQPLIKNITIKFINRRQPVDRTG